MDFAGGNVKNGRDIALFWVFDHRGGDSGGRDVSALSEVASEGEVLIMAGSPFRVRSVVEVGGAEGQARAEDNAAYYRAILEDSVMDFAHNCYVVDAVAVSKKKGRSSVRRRRRPPGARR